ncbi:MAG TPA: adenosylmethionine--8-amino-7-oxononanoate transaminase [Nitrospirota bacterium]|nr:adenosylmethionine--8-amino-7-oxononanoate transaminase [Nitrospirota bacterium]
MHYNSDREKQLAADSSGELLLLLRAMNEREERFLPSPRMKRQAAAENLEKLDKKYIWHPFTQMQDWEKDPQIIIESGAGSTLTDISGKTYLDGVSSLWVTVHGHRKKEIDRAVGAQLGRVAHSTLLGLSNVPAVLLAEKLVRTAPKGLTRVFYSDSGSTAVEIALKIAFQYWQQKGPEHQKKTGFLSLAGAYHGDTIGSVSVGGIDLFHAIYKPLLFQTRKIPSPHCYRCTYGLTDPDCQKTCFVHAERTIQKYASVTAALIIEPLVQGAAGMLTHPPGFLKKIRELCTKYKILMIADEVATGFGRTGKMFACEHEGVSPDILCVAKGLTGGYLPLAATLATEAVYQGFLGEYHEFRTFFHGHTYTGNPLACAAAMASMNLFEREKTLTKLRPKIVLLAKELKRFHELKHVGEVRQRGFMVGVELVKNRETKEPYPLAEKIGIRVSTECRKLGLLIRPLGNVIVLMPPLSVSLKDLKRMTDIIYDAVRRVTEGV